MASVIIYGSGFAGLSAAHELNQFAEHICPSTVRIVCTVGAGVSMAAGYATVIWRRERGSVGGRMPRGYMRVLLRGLEEQAAGLRVRIHPICSTTEAAMKLPAHKTMIVCTIGPASDSEVVLERLMRQGHKGRTSGNVCRSIRQLQMIDGGSLWT